MLHNHYETPIYNNYPMVKKSQIIAMRAILTAKQLILLEEGKTIKLTAKQSILLSVELFGLDGQWQW